MLKVLVITPKEKTAEFGCVLTVVDTSRQRELKDAIAVTMKIVGRNHMETQKRKGAFNQ
jgi:hypothetical protein